MRQQKANPKRCKKEAQVQTRSRIRLLQISNQAKLRASLKAARQRQNQRSPANPQASQRSAARIPTAIASRKNAASSLSNLQKVRSSVHHESDESGRLDVLSATVHSLAISWVGHHRAFVHRATFIILEYETVIVLHNAYGGPGDQSALVHPQSGLCSAFTDQSSVAKSGEHAWWHYHAVAINHPQACVQRKPVVHRKCSPC